MVNILIKNKFCGIVVRIRAHDLRVMGSKPALEATVDILAILK